MKNLKTYENYLTMEDQPKDSYDEYLYDNGFGPRYYICSKCHSNKMSPTPTGGFSPTKWVCDECGYDCGSPSWLTPEEYEEYLVRKETEKYNL